MSVCMKKINMYKEIINKIKPTLEKTVNYLKEEMAALQAGRATPSLLENIEIDVYGQKMPLKQLAAIQVPEPRLIVVRPWDKSIIGQIEKTVSQSRLGLSPIIDDDVIRFKIPPMSEERRKELAKNKK